MAGTKPRVGKPRVGSGSGFGFTASVTQRMSFRCILLVGTKPRVANPRVGSGTGFGGPGGGSGGPGGGFFLVVSVMALQFLLLSRNHRQDHQNHHQDHQNHYQNPLGFESPPTQTGVI